MGKLDLSYWSCDNCVHKKVCLFLVGYHFTPAPVELLKTKASNCPNYKWYFWG